MIAIDTNILVYAHRKDARFFTTARARVKALAEGGTPWAIPAPCLHEFLAIATHPRIYDPPSRLGQAMNQVTAWLESPGLVVLSEGPGYWELFERVLARSQVVGPRVHDARIATLCLHHRVAKLWTVDRDFSRFSELKVENPLVG